MLYTLFWVQAILALRQRWCRTVPALSLPSKVCFLIIFIAVAYVMWMTAFSVYRYTAPIELLAPLAIWLLARMLLSYDVLGFALAFATIIALTMNVCNGVLNQRGAWRQKSFQVDLPSIDDPKTATILNIGDAPQAWMFSFFPKEVAIASLITNFPESAQYVKQIKKTISSRGGKIYAVISALGTPEQNRMTVMHFRQAVTKYGLRILASTCKDYPAFLGGAYAPYQFCVMENSEEKNPKLSI